MAVYAEQYGLLFIGSPRTGSTAVAIGLVQHCGGRYLPEARVRHGRELVSKRHSTLEQLVRLGYLDRPPKELLKFVAVRNPFDSLVSAWAKARYRKDGLVARKELNFDAFLHWKIGKPKPRSMHAKFVDGVDEVIRYERLEHGLHSVLSAVGAPAFDLQIVNPTTERIGHYRDYYSADDRALVEKVFAEDLIRFEYEY